MQLCFFAGELDVAAVELLLQFAHVDVNRPTKSYGLLPLIAALRANCPGLAAAMLLNAKANANTNHEGRLALHMAMPHAEAVRALLVVKADANAFDEDGFTPLCAALRYYSGSRALLEHGADAGLPNRNGEELWALGSERSSDDTICSV